MKNTNELVRAEVDNLINTEWHRLVDAYQKSAYDLGISIKISMAGNQNVCEIVTGLEYYPLPKVKIKTDPVTADEKQIPLPIELEDDYDPRPKSNARLPGKCNHGTPAKRPDCCYQASV